MSTCAGHATASIGTCSRRVDHGDASVGINSLLGCSPPGQRSVGVLRPCITLVSGHDLPRDRTRLPGVVYGDHELIAATRSSRTGSWPSELLAQPRRPSYCSVRRCLATAPLRGSDVVLFIEEENGTDRTVARPVRCVVCWAGASTPQTPSAATRGRPRDTPGRKRPDPAVGRLVWCESCARLLVASGWGPGHRASGDVVYVARWARPPGKMTPCRCVARSISTSRP